MAGDLTDRSVLSCREFESVEIPLEKLIVGGALKIYPHADKYFDIDYRAGRLVVASKSFVGFVPINDRVALRVLPRFPISNLFYVLRRASARLNFIQGELSTYHLLEAGNGDPLEMLADRFAILMDSLLKHGLAMRYMAAKTPDAFRGTLDLANTLANCWSRGLKYQQHWVEDELTVNTPENALIKAALTRVFSFFRERKTSGNRKVIEKLALVCRLFESVDDVFLQDEWDVHKLLGCVPKHRKDYNSIIWISYLLCSQRGVAVESAGGVNFDTFVVNLAEVFEEYVRAIIFESFHAPKDLVYVKNGNNEMVRLMKGAQLYQVKPDIYVMKGKRCELVLDAKYKQSVKAADRYEVLAFCEALQCKNALIITPKSEGERVIDLGTTPGGIRFWRAQINLAANDMKDEEAEFVGALRKLPLNKLSAVLAV